MISSIFHLFLTNSRLFNLILDTLFGLGSNTTSHFFSYYVRVEKTWFENKKFSQLQHFWKYCLNFIRLHARSTFDIHHPYGIKLLKTLATLHEHKFRHCFQDTLNALCTCGKYIESTTHFSLHCTKYHISRQTLFQNIKNILWTDFISKWNTVNYKVTINPFDVFRG